MMPPKKGKPGPFDEADKKAGRERGWGRRRSKDDDYHKPSSGISVPDPKDRKKKVDYD